MNHHPSLTYASVFFTVFVRQLGIPVPAIVLLAGAGALVASGRMQAAPVLLLAITACLCADGIWFWMGRRWGSQVTKRLCRLTQDPRRCSKQAHEKFARFGPAILVVAKFIPGLDGLMPPLAGAEATPALSFIAFDGIGSLLWSSAYMLCGYALSNEMEWVTHALGRIGKVLVIALGVPLLLFLIVRGVRLVKMILRLRVRGMNAALLHQKINAGEKLMLIDLLGFEEESGQHRTEGISGAICAVPQELRAAPQLICPADVQVVLYCTSPQEVLSARVALMLQKKGIGNVWILEGGLDSWREQGFPLGDRFENPEAAGRRVGMKPR